MDNQNPNRSADLLTSHLLSSLKKEYMIVGRRRIKSWHAWLMIGLVAGATAGVTLVTNRSGRLEQSHASDLPAVSIKTDQMDALQRASDSLYALLEEYHVNSRPEIEQQMRDMAKARLDMLEDLVKKNPQTALDKRIPQSERRQYPLVVQNELEKDIDIGGTLRVVHSDNLKNNISLTTYTLIQGKNRFRLDFTRTPGGQLVSGMKVRITGMRVRQHIVVPVDQ